MTYQHEIDGQSVSLVAAAPFAGRSDWAVWAALDAENLALADALSEGRLRDASLHLARVEALTAEVGRRAAALNQPLISCGTPSRMPRSP